MLLMLRICVCDRPEKYEALKEEMKGTFPRFLTPLHPRQVFDIGC